MTIAMFLTILIVGIGLAISWSYLIDWFFDWRDGGLSPVDLREMADIAADHEVIVDCDMMTGVVLSYRVIDKAEGDSE